MSGAVDDIVLMEHQSGNSSSCDRYLWQMSWIFLTSEHAVTVWHQPFYVWLQHTWACYATVFSSFTTKNMSFHSIQNHNIFVIL